MKRLKDEYDLRYYQAIETEKNAQKRKFHETLHTLENKKIIKELEMPEHEKNQLLLRNEKLKSEELKVQVSNAANESWRCQWHLFPHQFRKMLRNIYSSKRCV